MKKQENGFVIRLNNEFFVNDNGFHFFRKCNPLSAKIFSTYNRAKGFLAKMNCLSYVGKENAEILPLKEVVKFVDGFYVKKGKVKKAKCVAFEDYCIIPIDVDNSKINIFETAKKAIKAELKRINDYINSTRIDIQIAKEELKGLEKNLKKSIQERNLLKKTSVNNNNFLRHKKENVRKN